MKKSIRILLTGLLTLVFLFSITQFWQQRQEKVVGNNSYSDALALATSEKTAVSQIQTATAPEAPAPELQWVPAPLEEEDPHIQTLEQINLEALREVNPDVIGWILIPDTKINYPILQGSDNDYYLKHTWDGKRYAVGSIFMEHLNHSDFTDFNTIIYGHNMNDGSMFAGIREYRNLEYWEKHPYIYIRNDQGSYRYEIFSSYLAKVGSHTYAIDFSKEESRYAFVNNAIVDSVIETGVEPDSTDRILTLSTCKGGSTTRWVVHARLKMILE